MICVKLQDQEYNRLSFYFDNMAEAEDLITMALKENFEISIFNAIPDNDPGVE